MTTSAAPAGASAWTAAVSPDDIASPPFAIAKVANFDEPRAMAFLPDRRMLATEKKGRLRLVDSCGAKTPVAGVPMVDYGGQGGLGDVATHPKFADNHLVYISYIEAGEHDTRGARSTGGRRRRRAPGAIAGDLAPATQAGWPRVFRPQDRVWRRREIIDQLGRAPAF